MDSWNVAILLWYLICFRKPINPGLLNTWLQKVGGYVDGSDLDTPIICELDSPYCSWVGYSSSTYCTIILTQNKLFYSSKQDYIKCRRKKSSDGSTCL